jgi:hypothetical protein
VATPGIFFYRNLAFVPEAGNRSLTNANMGHGKRKIQSAIRGSEKYICRALIFMPLARAVLFYPLKPALLAGLTMFSS